MRTYKYKEPGAWEHEKKAEVKSIKKIPERVDLWKSIIKDSDLNEETKKRLNDLVNFLLSVTCKNEIFAIPSEFSSVSEQLDALKDDIRNVYIKRTAQDDTEELLAVCKNLIDDVVALKNELYGQQ